MSLNELILTFIFIAIPENIVLFLLTSQILGLYRKELVPRLLLGAVAASIVTNLTHLISLAVGLLTFNLIANLVFIPLVLRIFIPIKLKKAIYMTLWMAAFASFYQILFSSIYVQALGFSLDELIKYMPFKIINVWIEVFVFGGIAYWMIRQNLQMPQTIRFEGFKKIMVVNSERSVLTLIVLMNIVAGLSIYTYSMVKEDVVFNGLATVWFNGFFVLVLIVLNLFLVSWLARTVWNGTMRAEQAELAKPALELKETLVNQRKFFIHQLQHLKQLASQQPLERFEAYVDGLVQDLEKDAPLFHVANPVLNIFLKAKLQQGEDEGILVHANIQDDLLDISLAPFELVKVMGRLIDSAFELAREQTPEKREVFIQTKRVEGQLVIQVRNIGLSHSMSSQESYLSSIRVLIEKHQGKLELLDRALDGVVHQVSLPGVVR